MVLLAVAKGHDLGKINPPWVKKSRLNLTGVGWIVHEYDSLVIVNNNPELLSEFDLDEAQLRFVKELIRGHCLPGQYFFGEGHLSGYKKVFDIAQQMKSDNPIKLFMIYGLGDVMAALNHRFVKPILNLHIQLSTLLTRIYHNVGFAHNPVNCSIRVIDYFAGLLNPAANILIITKYFAHIAQNI